MVVGRTDHLPGGAAPNWVSPKQDSGLMARYAVTLARLPTPLFLSQIELTYRCFKLLLLTILSFILLVILIHYILIYLFHLRRLFRLIIIRTDYILAITGLEYKDCKALPSPTDIGIKISLPSPTLEPSLPSLSAENSRCLIALYYSYLVPQGLVLNVQSKGKSLYSLRLIKTRLHNYLYVPKLLLL